MLTCTISLIVREEIEPLIVREDNKVIDGPLSALDVKEWEAENNDLQTCDEITEETIVAKIMGTEPEPENEPEPEPPTTEPETPTLNDEEYKKLALYFQEQTMRRSWNTSFAAITLDSLVEASKKHAALAIAKKVQSTLGSFFKKL